ncbi:MAG: hypothetical protein IMZ50_15570 [Candidatus Atribacteria bacterium]|nr:hypothetical protein [Candidatus Atribacteria bacterium]
MSEHTPGIMRAAQRLASVKLDTYGWLDQMATIIEDETGLPEFPAILARLASDDLAERVAGQYTGDRYCPSITACRAEAIADYRKAVEGAKP